MKTPSALRICAMTFAAGVCVIAFSGRGAQSSPPEPTITAMVEVSGTHSGYLETSHLERITFQMPGGTTGGTSGGTGGTTGAGGLFLLAENASVDGPPQVSFAGGTATGTTGATTTGSTGGDTGPFCDATGSVNYGFGVVNSSGYRNLTNDTTSATASEATFVLPPTTGTSYDTFSVAASAGDKCTLRITPSSQTVQAIFFVFTQMERYYKHADGTHFSTTYYNNVTYTILNYSMTRTTATAVAVDSRLAFGQPNLGGALPGDANAVASYVNFYPWIYKGGLFCGNSDFQYGGDLSGTARIEVQAGLPSTTQLQFEAVTLLNVGSPPQFTTPANLTGYRVSSGVSTDFSSATWSNVWPITGAASNSIDFTSFPNPEYANFGFGITGSTSSSAFTALFAVAASSEASLISGHTSEWQYFADSAYISSLTSASSSNTSSIPLSDALPRVWIADLTSSSSGSYLDGTGC